MVGNFASLLLAESLTSLNVTDGNSSSFKVTMDEIFPNQTSDLFLEDNMTSVVEVAELLNSSEKDLLDCGTMPDIVRVKVCSYF